MTTLAAHPLSHNDQIARLRLIRSANVGPQTYHQLLKRFGTAEAALEALPQMAGRKVEICPRVAAEQELERLQKLGGRFLFAGEPDFPYPLAAVEDAPPVLAALGRTELLETTAIGIVGARNASASARKLAKRFAEVLGDAGLVVASGLARGIDTAAHEGSLRTGTIAVFAGGVDVIYPQENEKLAAAIRNQGLILSETPLGTRPQARHFPRRNRIISGLSAGILVVEAALKSGSLITAQYAADQGRDVFAVPGSPLDPRNRGTNDLIRKGAWITETPDDIFRTLSNFQQPSRRQPAKKDIQPVRLMPQPAMSPEASSPVDDGIDARIIEILSPNPMPIDELIRLVALPAATVQESLLMLELAGRLTRHPGGFVSLDG